jgi:hypothetical protein
MALSESNEPNDAEVRQVCARMDEYLARLRQAGEPQQAVVGHAMNMASALLIQEFASVAAFREAARGEQHRFLERLDGIVRRLEDTHLGMSWGFRIFWMYARLLMESDPTIASGYWPEIARLGKLGAALGETAQEPGA